MDDIWGMGESQLIQMEDVIEDLLKKDSEEEPEEEQEDSIWIPLF
ncbi:MAG: hypothetical protein ABS913_02390 [Desemzia incerta]